MRDVFGRESIAEFGGMQFHLHFHADAVIRVQIDEVFIRQRLEPFQSAGQIQLPDVKQRAVLGIAMVNWAGHCKAQDAVPHFRPFLFVNFNHSKPQMIVASLCDPVSNANL